MSCLNNEAPDADFSSNFFSNCLSYKNLWISCFKNEALSGSEITDAFLIESCEIKEQLKVELFCWAGQIYSIDSYECGFWIEATDGENCNQGEGFDLI